MEDGINLMKVWKHNRTEGSASISESPIKKVMSLMVFRDLLLRAIMLSYTTEAAPMISSLAFLPSARL